ncbi:MAG: SH3 domain-containing protein [Zoogloeaceae bacterium]|jgi:hypothetical protein|nr:SH3 domain-containing protein [Zoogloeaceae bacterium]
MREVSGFPAATAVLCGVLCGMFFCLDNARAEAVHYNHAMRLTLRVSPNVGAAALARLPINQPLFIVGRENRWCRVRLVESGESTDSGQEGYVHCAFLQKERLDFAKLESEAARLFLELQRENLPPGEEARILEALFMRIERHFALSPSLYAYNDYRALFREAARRGAENPEFQLPAREKKRAAMLRELSRQSWEGNFSTVRQTVVTSGVGKTLRKLRSERRWDKIPYHLPEYRGLGEGGNPEFGDSAEESSNETFLAPSKASFFSQGKWAIGWAGGPMIRRRHGSYPPTYLVKFSNGGNEFVFNNVYEMAKALKAPVDVSSVMLLADEYGSNTGASEVPLLKTKLPVWAITSNGLVAGNLQQARLGPDDSACFGSPGSAEIVFERPLKGRIYGVFASNAPIDPALAKITARNETLLRGDFLGDERARLTHSEDAYVDIDGDGVADLSITLSTDNAANLEPSRPCHAVFNGNPGGFLRVAGYYDHNVYSLLVNEDGRWRALFLYDLVTCT